MGVNLAKALSHDPKDAWIGEVFLTAVVVVIAIVVAGPMLAFSVGACIAEASAGGSYPGSAVWLVAALCFPLAAWWACRQVHRRTHPPVPRRLYVVWVSAAVIAWALVELGVIVVGLLIGSLFFGAYFF